MLRIDEGEFMDYVRSTADARGVDLSDREVRDDLVEELLQEVWDLAAERDGVGCLVVEWEC